MADDKENKSDHVTQLSAPDVFNSHVQYDETIEEVPEDMAVSRISRSLSLSPLSRAFDAKYDLSSFLLCPELNLGDLAMPGIAISSLDIQQEHLLSESAPVPDLPLSPESLVKLPFGYLDREAFINFPNTTIGPVSLAKLGAASLQYQCSMERLDVDFTASLDLISRATTALAPFSCFALDVKFLLGDLQILKMQLDLLRTPLPFFSRSPKHLDTIRDITLDIEEPLRKIVTRVEELCGIEDPDRQKLGLAYAIKASKWQKLGWDLGVRDDVRNLRGLIGSRTSTISCLMTLASM